MTVMWGLLLLLVSALVAAAELENRIIGGRQSKKGDWPAMVVGEYCGGVLLAADMFLTAAHCVSAFPRNAVVYVGAYKAFYYGRAAGAESRRVRKRLRHPQWNKETWQYDLMLVQLDRPSKKEPLAYNRDDRYPELGQTMVAIGFGIIHESDKVGSDFLRETQLQKVATSMCRESYRNVDDGLHGIDGVAMFCAAAPNTDTCDGDSGGPIMSTDGLVLGITSFGEGCANPDFPGVYARLSTSRDWIDKVICRVSARPPVWCP